MWLSQANPLFRPIRVRRPKVIASERHIVVRRWARRAELHAPGLAWGELGRGLPLVFETKSAPTGSEINGALVQRTSNAASRICTSHICPPFPHTRLLPFLRRSAAAGSKTTATRSTASNDSPDRRLPVGIVSGESCLTTCARHTDTPTDPVTDYYNHHLLRGGAEEAEAPIASTSEFCIPSE